LSESEDSLKNKESKIEILNAEIDKKNEKIQDLKKSVDEKEAELSTKIKGVQDKEMKVTSLERELNQIRDKYEEQLKSKKAQIKKIKEDHKSEILEKERKMNELKADLNQFKEQNKELENQIESLDVKGAKRSVNSLVFEKMQEKMALQGFISEKDLEVFMQEAKDEIEE
jgi:DNA repair exonuclease SbcCD ATPase subunit